MNPIVSQSKSNLETLSNFSNNEKIIIQLAEFGKMNKWDIKKKTDLPYPRVHESVEKLEKDGFVERVGKKRVKNKLPSPIFGLTFKGIITYLSLQELTPLEFWGTQGKEELKKRFLRSKEKRLEEIQKLIELLKNFGKEFNYQIFIQIDWLVENYNDVILEKILKMAKTMIINPSQFFKASKKHEKLEERNLINSIDLIRKNPFLQKMMSYKDNGTRKIYRERDVLKDRENRLEILRKEMGITIKSENEYLKKLFANDFFVKLSYMKKIKREGNQVLAEIATKLLEEKRHGLLPLENIVKQFREEN